MTTITTQSEHVDGVSGAARLNMGLVEFIITIAVMTASVAIAIDSMLPALPSIGQSLSVANSNDTQLVIGVFFLGFGFRRSSSAAFPIRSDVAPCCSAALPSSPCRCLPPP